MRKRTRLPDEAVLLASSTSVESSQSLAFSEIPRAPKSLPSFIFDSDSAGLRQLSLNADKLLRNIEPPSSSGAGEGVAPEEAAGAGATFGARTADARGRIFWFSGRSKDESESADTFRCSFLSGFFAFTGSGLIGVGFWRLTFAEEDGSWFKLSLEAFFAASCCNFASFSARSRWIKVGSSKSGEIGRNIAFPDKSGVLSDKAFALAKAEFF